MKRSLTLTAAVLALGAATATAASADVTSEVTGTTLAGGTLTIAGTGVSLALSGTPGSIVNGVSATALSVSDLRGTTAGWQVTATYAAPTVGISIGGGNVLVSAGNVVADPLGGVDASKVAVATDEPLTGAVTVASTTVNDGSGLTTMTSGLKVRIPVTAKVGDVYGGKVVYTVSSVR